MVDADDARQRDSERNSECGLPRVNGDPQQVGWINKAVAWHYPIDKEGLCPFFHLLEEAPGLADALFVAT